jgi:hypothetical protein
MNSIETFIYNIVRGNPALKQLIRNIYQRSFDLLPRKREYFVSSFQIQENFFFGFHDITPFSFDETKLLANHNTFDLRMPKVNEGLDIGFFDFSDGRIGKFHKLGVSFAWNYHKGCRLQWLDEKQIIFNTAINNKLVSKIINVETKEEQVVGFPIDSIYSDKDISLATSFSYERLERCMPGYGYPYQDNGYIEKLAPVESGLFLVDLKRNTRNLLVSLASLAETVSEEYQNGYIHFVTHSEFSPNGRYISFLYRWISNTGDYMKRWTRMMVYDLKTNQLIILPSQNSGSHYVWNKRNQLIASCIMDGKSCHVLFDMMDVNNYKIIAGDKLNSDGHQSFISDTSFITDTYPDRYRMAKIYKADTETDQTELLVSVYSPKEFQTKDFKCHIACDLHPRVSPSGKYICFDSPRTGKRSLCILNL